MKYAYVITCDEVIRDQDGKASELICSYNPDTRAGATPESAKRVKGIIQWVSTKHAVPIEVNRRSILSPSHVYRRIFMIVCLQQRVQAEIRKTRISC